MINRRQFGLLTLSGLLSASNVRAQSSFTPYRGPFLMTVHVGGGWDLSLYTDPKVNVAGEPEISHWAREAGIETASGIPFAPVANSREFFEKHGAKTLVINGIDTQTNAHQTGERHSWTGSAAEGRPSLAPLFAAARGAELPIQALNFGTFSANADVGSAVPVDPGVLKSVLVPRLEWSNSPEEAEILARYRTRGLQLQKANSRSSWETRRLTAHDASVANTESLGLLGELLPDELPAEIYSHQGSSFLPAEAEVGLLAFKAGLTAAAECSSQGNWDTHSDGEFAQVNSITALNTGLDYIWSRAEALGIADQLTVVVTSDFGRTPYYNSSGGKDHWPVNSYLVMETTPGWGGRVIGSSDELQGGIKYNPTTMKPTGSGEVLVPAQVHAALHKHLGIDAFAESVGYHFPQVEPITLG